MKNRMIIKSGNHTRQYLQRKIEQLTDILQHEFYSFETYRQQPGKFAERFAQYYSRYYGSDDIADTLQHILNSYKHFTIEYRKNGILYNVLIQATNDDTLSSYDCYGIEGWK